LKTTRSSVFVMNGRRDTGLVCNFLDVLDLDWVSLAVGLPEPA